MPTLEFRGKQHIYAHHLTVPYRPLVLDPAKSHGDNAGEPDDNLIIHGDNLEALKALLPRYAGKVNCIYIDPPYNTGNEGWTYNDNVNSPLMREWLAKNNPVDGEDLERHDKWLCMMWPRLQLLLELLADDGIIFVSIDDNEQHHLRMLMDEIFGETNFLNSFTWVNNLKGRQLTGQGAARTHETILAYGKDIRELSAPFQIDISLAKAIMPDAYRMGTYEKYQDEIGPYVIKNQLHNTNSKVNEETRPALVFNIHYAPELNSVRFTDVDSDLHISGFTRIPPKASNDGVHKFHAWRWSRQKIDAELHNLHFERYGETFRIHTKIRVFDETSLKDLITNVSNSNSELKSLSLEFPFPKPADLVKVLIQSVRHATAIFLDSFAGSGTTAHAALALNKQDGGSRRFILVECEDYADTITAERVRRVINGVPEAKGEDLREGLGGSFTYCTLGEPIEAERMLTGETLPNYHALAAHLLYTAKGITASRALQQPTDGDPFYSDPATDTDYYLLYQADPDWLRGNDAMLSDQQASDIAHRGRAAVVFAAGKYMGQGDLTRHNITFCQLPYDLHRSG